MHTDVAHMSYKDDRAEIMIRILPPKLRAKFNDFLKKNKFDTDKQEGFTNACIEFVNSYVNDYNWDNFEGLMCDIINETLFNDAPVFQFDNARILVVPNIPENEDDKRTVPTKDDIKRILNTYMGLICTEPIVCKRFPL